MSNIAIKAENISKAYQLGQFSTGTLSRDIERAWAKLRGKEDPFLMIGETNDRTVKSESNIVWSLKDINFEIEQGDAVGIIGRNGAGKSTLLKVLSRVTSPTTGEITGVGRIASLLEVGTGFHPELSGRENIFLNGAILGMRKAEIKRKFDEIVDFSGVERYIDTPVKRYSSGMYVRLAFAVAAHLESEILIVDEVLAVGDAEFQKKCLGKMGEVSKGEGRTILFVSHNMAAVTTLCKSGIYLKNGQLETSGSVSSVMSKYLASGTVLEASSWDGNEGDENIRITRTCVYPRDSTYGFHTNVDLVVEIEGEIIKPIIGLILGFKLWSQYEYELAYCLHDDSDKNNEIETVSPQKFVKRFIIPANTLAEGEYRIQFDVGIHRVKRIIENECDISFSLVNINGIGKKYINPDGRGLSSIFRPAWAVKDVF